MRFGVKHCPVEVWYETHIRNIISKVDYALFILFLNGNKLTLANEFHAYLVIGRTGTVDFSHLMKPYYNCFYHKIYERKIVSEKGICLFCQ